MAANNVRVAPKTTGRAKKSKAASGPDGDSPQLLHPVSVTIPVGNRHVGSLAMLNLCRIRLKHSQGFKGGFCDGFRMDAILN